MLNVILENEKMEVAEGTLYHDLAREYEKRTGFKPYLIRANGIVKELRRHVRNGEDLSFLYYDNDIVKDVYARTAVFILLKAIHDVIGNDVRAGLKFRVHNAYYFETEQFKLSKEDIEAIKKEFKEIVNSTYLIKKESVSKQDAVDMFEKLDMKDVRLLFQYSYRPVINIRVIDGFIKYINGELLYDTSYVKYYEIKEYNDGLLLILPEGNDVSKVEYRDPGNKFFNIHNISVNWAKQLGINTVGKLNDKIAKDGFNDLVIMTESFQDKQIGDVASTIKSVGKKIIFIAGPTSSGKTSFSHRLMYHLRALNYVPHPISCDDFFKERSETPKLPNGEYDFENITTVDIKLLNETLNKLLSGEEVDLPRFDFTVGTKIFGERKLKINDSDLIILEGIHCLNPALTPSVDENNIFKIYVSALTEVCIDNANRIATSDLRLIRRLVRDYKTRGTEPKFTLKRWKSVREGEEKYIFPFQEEADILFNSALIYEFSVLKLKALPMLYSLTEDNEVGETAKRLVKILNYFLGVDTEVIPHHSLVREFIGGSILKV